MGGRPLGQPAHRTRHQPAPRPQEGRPQGRRRPRPHHLHRLEQGHRGPDVRRLALRPSYAPELFEIERLARLTQQPLRPGASHEERIRHARLAEQIATFHAQIAALAPYALVPNGRRKANGSRRFFTCTFGLKNATPSQLGRKASAQATITLSKEVLGKHYQPHRWGTREWMATFARRTAIEGVFGILKSRSGQGMNRGWIRVLGITATALMTAAALVSYNLQIVRAWARKNDIDADTLYTAPTQDTPRPDDLDANVNPQAPGAPPAA